MLRNPSNVTIHYELDLKALADLNEANYNFPIFTFIGNNRRGEIPSKSFVSIAFIFQPIEMKLYKLELPITYNVTYRDHLNILGAARISDDNICQEESSLTKQIIERPKQSVILSSYIFDCGHLNPGQSESGFIIICNKTSSPVKYDWQLLYSAFETDEVLIWPEMGRIEARSQNVCSVKLYTSNNGTARLSRVELSCVINPIAYNNNTSKTITTTTTAIDQHQVGGGGTMLRDSKSQVFTPKRVATASRDHVKSHSMFVKNMEQTISLPFTVTAFVHDITDVTSELDRKAAKDYQIKEELEELQNRNQEILFVEETQIDGNEPFTSGSVIDGQLLDKHDTSLTLDIITEILEQSLKDVLKQHHELDD